MPEDVKEERAHVIRSMKDVKLKVNELDVYYGLGIVNE